MISLKQKYIGLQVFSAAISVGAIVFVFYFCANGFTNLVGISAKNLDALYNTSLLQTMLWEERSELRAYLRQRSTHEAFESTAEKISLHATAVSRKSSDDFRTKILEFIRIHDEMRANVRASRKRTDAVRESEDALENALAYYDRGNAALIDAGEILLLGSHDQQSAIIRNSKLAMKIALVATVGLSCIISFLSFLYLRRKVIDPIMAISTASLEAAKGNYRPIPATDSSAEIATLATNFNGMMTEILRTSRELSEFNRKLEAKVEERTARLLEAEARLVTTAKMSALGEMAGGVAHEINTPLATIVLLTGQIGDMTKAESTDRAAIARLSDRIALTVRRISLIVKGLRTFSRDGSVDSIVPTPLRQIVEETLMLCSEKLKFARIDVEVELPPEEILIPCRSVQISQVFLNLIGNAYDAIQRLPEKWIRIGVEAGEGRVRISFTDCGSGIPEDVRAKLFQPFFTTKEIGKGTGLGLSISKGIIAAHGGTIELDLEAANTRFLIELPRFTEEALFKSSAA